MAKKKKETTPKPKPKKEGPKIFTLQVWVGVAAFALAANSYASFYPLPKIVLETFLVLVGIYMLVRAQERRAYTRRLDVIKKHI